MLRPKPENVLAAIGAAFDASVGPALPPEGRARAYAHALAVLESGPPTSTSAPATVGFAADLYLSAVVELAADLPQQVELIAAIGSVSGISAETLGRAVLRAPRLVLLPTSVACEVTLTMLIAFAGLDRAALFTRVPGGALTLLSHAGQLGGAKPDLRALAGELLDGVHADTIRRSDCAGTKLELQQPHVGALVVGGRDTSSHMTVVLIEVVAPMLAAVLDQGERLGRERSSDDAATVERRLARLRFDLHDGPQQDVIMLADDLRLFATQFAAVYGNSDHAEIVLGRLDDLQARLVTIDGDLRRIAAFVQSPFLHPEPLPFVLDKLVDSFVERSTIEPHVSLTGDFDCLSDSQQITLLGLIREALSNIREHSQATEVKIALHADTQGVRGSVVDNGRGFDPETTLVQAARSGHLGLVGMYERVRMLGGVTQIDSRPGGPTVISVSLPVHTPAMAQAAGERDRGRAGHSAKR